MTSRALSTTSTVNTTGLLIHYNLTFDLVSQSQFTTVAATLQKNISTTLAASIQNQQFNYQLLMASQNLVQLLATTQVPNITLPMLVNNPTVFPTSQPTALPSGQPSSQPSSRPSRQPTSRPSCQPSNQPSSQPSAMPTTQPTSRPSGQPSGSPSTQPSSK